MKFELKKKLVAKSEKVKSVDFHPTLPWVLIGLYNGAVSVYDYNTQACLQYMEITNKTIRAVKFIAEKTWFVAGSDDMKIRVFNYNTMERIKEFDAHTDLIRCIVLHQKGNFMLSSSDDQTICMWDIDKDFAVERVFNEHSSYVMKLAVNLKDHDMFASGSTDKKIKIWSFNSKTSSLTIEGHTKGITSVAFCPLGDKPYLASGSDDKTIKIWDYTNKTCIATLESHEDIVSAIAFHSELPILISASEDYYCKFWNINNFKLEDSKMFGYDTIWDIAVQTDNNIIALGCDEATLVMRMGSEQPLAIFNQQQAKIIYCKQNSLYSINLKTMQEQEKDQEILNYSAKPLGTTELFPLSMKFSPNGRHFAVISEKDFVISTSGVYRDTYAGSCTDLAWSLSGDFAIKDGQSVKIFKGNKEESKLSVSFYFDNIFGGPLLALKNQDSVYFYDFDTQILIRKIDSSIKEIIWNDNKTKVALVSDDVTFILNFNNKEVEKYIESITNDEEEAENDDGCEEAFDPVHEINETLISGIWYDDVFIYHTSKNKLNYLIETQSFSITTLNSSFTMLGFYQASGKIFFMTKSFQLMGVNFPISFINYQGLILKKDYAKASALYKEIPSEYHEKVCRFLEKFNLFELSYSLTTNQQRKFELAVKLRKLEDAIVLCTNMNKKDNWKITADLAMDLGEFKLAEESMKMAGDYSGLLMYYSCISNKEKLQELAVVATSEGLFNIAFNCYFQLNDLNKCVQILLDSNQIAEAALFCRTYVPSALAQILSTWNDQINEIDPSQRTLLKIINPLDHIENKEKVEESEQVVNDFYKLANSQNCKKTNRLMSFQDIDILAELEKGNIDLTELLQLNEPEQEEIPDTEMRKEEKPVEKKAFSAYDEEEEEYQ